MMTASSSMEVATNTTAYVYQHQHAPQQQQRQQRKKVASTIMSKYKEELAMLDNLKVEMVDEQSDDSAYFAAYF